MNEELEKFVVSPDGATLRIDQNLYDEADPNYALSVTVHRLGERKSACNFWMNYFGEWYQIQPERVIEEEPTAYMLQGEIVRLTENLKLARKFDEDFRLKLGVSGLMNQIEGFIEKQ